MPPYDPAETWPRTFGEFEHHARACAVAQRAWAFKSPVSLATSPVPGTLEVVDYLKDLEEKFGGDDLKALDKLRREVCRTLHKSLYSKGDLSEVAALSLADVAAIVGRRTTGQRGQSPESATIPNALQPSPPIDLDKQATPAPVPTGPSPAKKDDPPTSKGLSFAPGGFRFQGSRLFDLEGKPLAVLKQLANSKDKRCTCADLQKTIWQDQATGMETVRSAVMKARKALRAALKTLKIRWNQDPILCVDRGPDLAWKLNLPD